uniref:NADH dehydrogenase subunit 6 n=3 Tax=Formica TaxID=72766 RepID=A0A872YNE2_9HYME|nr:NADH dehydrogenase subunit 6 [Formica glauca]QNV11994.1 NADH dehydrogenase subunit 6 [Formica rufibarbis]QOY24479.1 NADH dehydrogenase subunit 6 [Formica sp. DM656]QOY24506.1 NADH dehydrogenase subunit 6 [Formica sp. DM659]WAK85258.1 NADH dehydrogenase subunit 6 [Formica glauca]
MNKELSIFNIFIMFLMLMNLFILIMNIMLIHPIIIIIFMLIYSSIICINMSLWKSNYLYSIMLFLIMISGLLIIFLYFSSLISNEQINFKLNKFMFLSFIINFMIFLYLNSKLNFFYLLMKKYNFSESNYLMKFNEMNFQNILYLYEYPFNNITISSMFYLLITLFSIIKICSTKSISMRKIN